MPHRRHIYTKAYDMERATMCDNSQWDHALPHWKCVLRCCAQCSSINILDQETDDKHPKPSPSISFHIYHLISRCIKHGRLLWTDKKICCKYQRDSASGKSAKKYTRKERVMMETTISNFHTSFLFQKSRSWRFTFLMYKYCVQITVVTLVELRLNAMNHLKICYVAVIMLRG